MTFGRYLRRLFGVRLAATLLALAALLQLVDLMDRYDEILGRGLGWWGMVQFAALRLPLALPSVIPLAALSAAILTFAVLTHTSEIAAMRASGLSLARLVGWLVPLGILAGIAQFALADFVGARADAAFARWWAANDPAPKEKGVSFRLGMDVVVVGAVRAEGAELEDVTIHRRDAEGMLVSTLRARSAQWRDGRWVLLDGRVLPPGQAATFATAEWEGGPAPANLLELIRPQPLQPVNRLNDILSGRWVGAESDTAYRVRLWRAFAQPVVPVMMLLLATPVAGGLRRSGGIPAGMAMGLAAGLSYLVLDGIVAALGEAGTLPPLMAALVPHAVFACVGLAMLLYAEG